MTVLWVEPSYWNTVLNFLGKFLNISNHVRGFNSYN